MGTRATVKFGHGEKPQAALYFHYDGYPQHMLPFFEKFFTAVENDTNDTRFGDSQYLAAKLVAFHAREYGDGLDFTGIGVVTTDHSEQYNYHMDCGNLDKSGRPTITYTEGYL